MNSKSTMDSNVFNEKLYENQIINEDCITYMKKLPDKHINSFILDPPYYEVVSASWDNKWNTFNEYLQWFEEIIIELSRIGKHSCNLWVFGFPYQLSYLLPLFEKYGFKYRQHITINKGLKSVSGRTSNKLKMFPIASEYIMYFYKDSRDLIKSKLQEKQKEKKLTSNEINKYLGKAINGGGTWSTIAGKRQKNIQYPTREDWDKLNILFDGIGIKYDDYVYKFNLPTKLTDVWDDINFYDRTYKNLWKQKYDSKCPHPTMKPYKLIDRLIQCSTDEGDIVLDIFMGTGMTGKVCIDNNRKFYGCELDKVYINKSLIYL
jgi:DNA modification methylase